MNSRTLRRLAADHGALHGSELPPNYLFPTDAATDDLTQLDILLAGPTFTPFALGVWKLHLAIPPNYPQQPPTANFRTPIFHPNVDPQTGGVCVETLKRDWDSKLTLRDVLITISCLLIQPNPDSALNAEAGTLIQENYEAYTRRVELMTSIHAVIPNAMRTAVLAAQNRGQETHVETEEKEEEEDNKETKAPEAPARRRRTIAKVREGMRRVERSEVTPTGPAARRRQQDTQSQAFVFQAGQDDVFGISTPAQNSQMEQLEEDDDEDMVDGEQENNASHSPTKSWSPVPTMTPRRPRGVAVPLGELIMEQEEQDTSEEMEPEYPPSPRKSPSKSPPKRKQARTYDSVANIERAESSRDAAVRAPNITPPNFNDKPLALADDSTFMDITFEGSISPRRKGRGLFQTPAKRPPGGLQLGHGVQEKQKGLFARKSSSSIERKRKEEEKRVALEAKLWTLCGQDIKRWNRGDFDGEPFKKKAGRW